MADLLKSLKALAPRPETLAAAACGALLYAAVQQLQAKRAARAAAAAAEEMSTTSSSHSGSVYETQKAVAEYLQFHFGADDDILPYANGPRSALNFATRTADLCIDWCQRVGLPLTAALDVGCAVGRTSFDLSRSFGKVVGLDFSHAFVEAANRMKSGSAEYTYTVEGAITAKQTVRAPASARPDVIKFVQGDACALDASMGPFSVIHGANLLCRLPEPRTFLEALPGLLVPHGLVVLVSPYSWLKQYTPQDKWVGASVDAATGAPKRSAVELTAIMTGLGFKLIHEEEVPFLIREHARKFQWGCSHATIWQKQ